MGTHVFFLIPLDVLPLLHGQDPIGWPKFQCVPFFEPLFKGLEPFASTKIQTIP